MLRIGEFARRTGTTIKALRHYDRLRLLRPEFVDPATGYRSYHPDQVQRVERILKYRGFGFTLAEIRHLLREDAATVEVRRTVETRESLLRQELAAVQRQLAAVAAWRRSLEMRDHRAFPIALRKIPARQVVSLRRHLLDVAGVDALLAEMRAALPANSKVTDVGAVWHAADRPEKIDCEALLYVDGNVPVPPEYRNYRLDGGLVASVLHDESEPSAFPGVFHYARDHVKPLGYQVQCPCREMYFEPAGSTFALTEIQFRLQKHD